MGKGDTRFIVDISLEDVKPEVDTYFWDEDHDPPPLVRPKIKKKGRNDPKNKGRPGPQ